MNRQQSKEHSYSRNGFCRCGGKQIILKGRSFCVLELKDELLKNDLVLVDGNYTYTDLDLWAKKGLISDTLFNGLWDRLKVRGKE